MGLGGSLLRRFALVFVAVIGIAVVAPITATAATAYFSQVTTVRVEFGDATGNSSIFEGWRTAWCPAGYKVTGGGFETLEVTGDLDVGYLTGSMPTSNSSGRRGWRVRFTGNFPGVAHVAVYAQCVR
jgi:hypothetical protein